MKKQNSQLGIRISKDILEEYSKECATSDTVPSKRIRRFIQLDLEYAKNGKDIFKNLDKRNGK